MEEPPIVAEFNLKPSYKDRYINPKAPPGDNGPRPSLEYEENIFVYNGLPCRVLGLLDASGVLDISNPPSDFDFGVSTDSDEIEEIPVVKPPVPLITLEEDLSSSEEGEINTQNVSSEKSTVRAEDDANSKDGTKSKDGGKSKVDSKSKDGVKSKDHPKSKDSLNSKQDPKSKDNLKLKEQKSLSKQETRGKSEKNREKERKTEKSHSKDKYYKDRYRSRRERSYDRYSSDEDYVSKDDRERSRRKVKKSRSGSEDEYIDEKKYNIKEEDGDILGSNYCYVCSINLNSRGTYLSHINGKRHLKALKLQDTSKAILESAVVIPDVSSRYPPVPVNVERVPVHEISSVQQTINEQLRYPCPGMENVTAIHCLTNEVIFYCKLCDSPCSASSIVHHLNGHKHQLNCLKLFDSRLYEAFQYKKKSEIELRLMQRLQELERKYGRGNMKVEKEVERSARDKKYATLGYRSTSKDEPMPGPSHQSGTIKDKLDPKPQSGVHRSSTRDEPVAGSSHQSDYPEQFDRKLTIADQASPDFYCETCDSHMNSVNMWHAHIRGKRHLANVKKAPGERPSKVRSIVAPPHIKPILYDYLADVEDPVVGLSEMRETQNPDASGPVYNCYLCGACMTEIDVVEHILSQKHRTKYLEFINHEDIQTLKAMNISSTKTYSIIEETCHRVEQERGRGNIQVHIMRNAVKKW